MKKTVRIGFILDMNKMSELTNDSVAMIATDQSGIENLHLVHVCLIG